MDQQETQESPQEHQQHEPVQNESGSPEQELQDEAQQPRVDVDSLFSYDDDEDDGRGPVERTDRGDPGVSDRAFRTAVAAMLRGGPGSSEAARRVLMESGFSKSEADKFVVEAGYEGAAPAPAPTPQAPARDPEMERALHEARERASVAEERSKAVRAKQLEQEMDYQLYKNVTEPEVDGFIRKLDELNEGEDEASRNDRRQVMVQEIRRMALENLGNRTRKANRFDETWISEEVRRASSQVVGRYRVALGNVDRLGRASVVAGPEDELRRSKPATPPAWKPGKQVSDMDTEIRDWTVDVLSRAALDGGSGESKL